MMKEIEERESKLGMMKWWHWSLSCVMFKKRNRRIMNTLIRGTTAFQIEVGRWSGENRKERVSEECQKEVDETCHWSYRSLSGISSGWLKKSVGVMVYKDSVKKQQPVYIPPTPCTNQL